MNLSNTALFVFLDDFAKLYETWERHRLIPTSSKRQRSGKLCLGDMRAQALFFILATML